MVLVIFGGKIFRGRIRTAGGAFPFPDAGGHQIEKGGLIKASSVSQIGYPGLDGFPFGASGQIAVASGSAGLGGAGDDFTAVKIFERAVFFHELIHLSHPQSNTCLRN